MRLDTTLGYIGGIMTLGAEWVMKNYGTVSGICTTLLGLVLLIYSIREKIKKDRLLDIEIKIKEKQLYE